MTTTISSSNIGARLEQAARFIAPAIALAYVAGYSLGSWIHRTSDQLSRYWVAALGLEQPAMAEQPQQQPQQAPAAQVSPAPVIKPIQADAAPAPAALPTTVKGLRALARERGIPSKCWKSARKVELQALLAG